MRYLFICLVFEALEFLPRLAGLHGPLEIILTLLIGVAIAVARDRWRSRRTAPSHVPSDADSRDGCSDAVHE